MNKILVQVITIKSPDDSLKKSLEKLEKSYPIELKIHKFEKCKDYKGKSDGNICSKYSVFNNWKFCINYLLSTNYPYTLILEDDIIWKGNIKKGIKKALKYMNNNSNWDIFLLGGSTMCPFIPINLNIIKHTYSAHSHSMFINRKYANKFLSLEYDHNKDKNVDIFLFNSSKVYGLLFPIGYQKDNKHFYEEIMSHYGYLIIYIMLIISIIFIIVYKIFIYIR